MANSGKDLEGLVAFVEETLLEQGFNITTNRQVFDDDGNQIAEFDIEIRKKIRTTEFSWLIECRDRPSKGAAPVSWIEQLVGRRKLHKFDRVTAVSTTGFSPGAVRNAKLDGIELREVRSLEPECFSDWILMTHLECYKRVHQLTHARLIVDGEESLSVQEELLLFLQNRKSNEPLLKSTTTGRIISIDSAFLGAVSQTPSLFEDVLPDQTPKPIKLRTLYSEDDCFTIEISTGPVRIKEIHFAGELSINKYFVPMQASEYKNSETGEVISQVATFPFATEGKKLSLEMHRIPESEHTHVMIRKISGE